MCPESWVPSLTGLDQLQNLRPKASSTSLTIQGLQNQPRRGGEISRICTLPGLPITNLCTMEQMVAI
jgi:hypothetical protein